MLNIFADKRYKLRTARLQKY